MSQEVVNDSVPDADDRHVLDVLRRELTRSGRVRVLEIGAGVGTMIARLADWIARGRAGEMTYLSESLDERLEVEGNLLAFNELAHAGALDGGRVMRRAHRAGEPVFAGADGAEERVNGGVEPAGMEVEADRSGLAACCRR